METSYVIIIILVLVIVILVLGRKSSSNKIITKYPKKIEQVDGKIIYTFDSQMNFDSKELE